MDSKQQFEIPLIIRETTPGHEERPAYNDTTLLYSRPLPLLSARLSFWKVATVGLGAGMAVGALLAFGGYTEALLQALGIKGAPVLDYALSMGMGGLLGAALGGAAHRPAAISGRMVAETVAESAKITEKTEEIYSPSAVNTVVYGSFDPELAANTHSRDKALASARQALLSMDHTKAVSH